MNTLSQNRPLSVVIAGHVDHGKSTFVGRLLHETESLPDGKLEEVHAMCARRGVDFEWSFVLDALQVERDQGITLDTTRIWFKSDKRKYMIIDAPGHKEFLKNMVTGAASAEVALLVIDANEGVSEQTRRHAYLLSLLGVNRVVVAVNKMDLVDYDKQRFDRVDSDIRDYLGRMDVTPNHVVPVSARDGAGVTEGNEKLNWHAGPTVLAALDEFEPEHVGKELPLRLPVQDVYRQSDRRLIVGRIESGVLKAGQDVRFAPSGQQAKIRSIEGWNEETPRLLAEAGRSVAITLDDELFIERGEMMTGLADRPLEHHHIHGRVFWFNAEELAPGRELTLRIGTADHLVEVQSIERSIDVDTLDHHETGSVGKNDIAEITLRSRTPVVADLYRDNPNSGRGVLMHGYEIVGGFVILEDAVSAARNLTRVSHAVTRDERTVSNGHRGGVLWMTGLSGAGKSTVAMALERRLHERRWQVFTIDGDNFRHGLSRDLGFSPEDRAENIRRAAEVAKLMAESGTLVLATFISPLRSDRQIARDVIGDGFHEVHIHADLNVCESRDPKGLYARARTGEIPQFTGISAPYEVPLDPGLRIDTGQTQVSKAVADIAEYAQQALSISDGKIRAVS